MAGLAAYLWIKAFHIVFVASWFAGLFYLPRIFVNLAQEDNPAARERLLGMGRRPLPRRPSAPPKVARGRQFDDGRGCP